MTTHENGDQTVSDERDLRSHQIMELSRAIERVTALADKWEADAKRNDDAEPVSSDGLTRMILSARYLRMNASDLRAAIAGPQ